jgi:hypothetical protein
MIDRTDAPTLPYLFEAVRHPHKPGRWLARYQAPGLGVRHVRERGGATAVYDTEPDARRAACAALIRALNDPPESVRGGRILRVLRSAGRSTRAFRLAEAASRGK